MMKNVFRYFSVTLFLGLSIFGFSAVQAQSPVQSSSLSSEKASASSTAERVYGIAASEIQGWAQGTGESAAAFDHRLNTNLQLMAKYAAFKTVTYDRQNNLVKFTLTGELPAMESVLAEFQKRILPFNPSTK